MADEAGAAGGGQVVEDCECWSESLTLSGSNGAEGGNRKYVRKLKTGPLWDSFNKQPEPYKKEFPFWLVFFAWGQDGGLSPLWDSELSGSLFQGTQHIHFKEVST